MKKALIIRYGAYGDTIIFTPVLRRLKQEGWHITVHTSERGFEILKQNPNVDEFVHYMTDSVPNELLHEHWDNLIKKLKPDATLNLTESIETKLCTHSSRKEYYLNRDEREKICNLNYYEETAKMASKAFNWDYAYDDLTPEIYFTKREIRQAKQYIKYGSYNILFCMSGSSISKMYPWNVHLVDEIHNQHPDANIITVGDHNTLAIEEITNADVKLCNKIPFRISAALTSLVDLVITPDTGILHATACFDTNTIALLGQTSKENITKHFINTYTIEADCFCAPCFRIINDSNDCPKDKTTGACLCMGYGISPFEILTAINNFRQGE